MPITTIPVPPIHCALCRARLVGAVEALGARPLAAVIGSEELVVDTDDVVRVAAVQRAVAAVAHDR